MLSAITENAFGWAVTVVLGAVLVLTALALYDPRMLRQCLDLRFIAGAFLVLLGLCQVASALPAARYGSTLWLASISGWTSWLNPWQSLVAGVLCCAAGFALMVVVAREVHK